MPALTIGTLDLLVLRQPTADGAVERISAEGGALSRGMGGALGGAVRWQKRALTIRLAPMDDAELAALSAEIPFGALVTCSGDVLGGSGLWAVTITEQRAKRIRGGDHRWWVTLSMDEA